MDYIYDWALGLTLLSGYYFIFGSVREAGFILSLALMLVILNLKKKLK